MKKIIREEKHCFIEIHSDSVQWRGVQYIHRDILEKEKKKEKKTLGAYLAITT